MDHARDTVGIREYRYQKVNKGKIWSSGILMSFPQYYEKPEPLYYLPEGFLLSYSCIPVSVYSNSQIELGSTSGSHIGYSSVTIVRPGNGRTVNEYTSAIEYPDISTYHFPFAPATSFDWKRGLLKRKTVFTEDGKIRMKEEYVYNSPDDTVHNIMIPAIKVVQKFPDNIYTNVYSGYVMRTGWNHLVKKVSYRYDLSGHLPLMKEEKFTYSPYHYQLLAIEANTSDSMYIVTRSQYPTGHAFTLPAAGCCFEFSAGIY